MITLYHYSGEICHFHLWGMRVAVQDEEVPDTGIEVQELGLQLAKREWWGPTFLCPLG
jgi:hypothetical protein